MARRGKPTFAGKSGPCDEGRRDHQQRNPDDADQLKEFGKRIETHEPISLLVVGVILVANTSLYNPICDPIAAQIDAGVGKNPNIWELAQPSPCDHRAQK